MNTASEKSVEKIERASMKQPAKSCPIAFKRLAGNKLAIR
jgi:hypothetical protein